MRSLTENHFDFSLCIIFINFIDKLLLYNYKKYLFFKHFY